MKNIEANSYLIYFGVIEPKTTVPSNRIETAFGNKYVIYCGEHRSKAYYANQNCEPNCSLDTWFVTFFWSIHF